MKIMQRRVWSWISQRCRTVER